MTTRRTSSTIPLILLNSGLALSLVACAGDDAAGTSDESYGGSATATDGGSGDTGWGSSSGGSGSASASGGDTAGSTGTSGATSDSSGGDETGGEGTTGGEDPTTGDDSTTGDTTTGGEEVCDDQSPVTLYLSPDDSNSMSSPVQVRETILGGWQDYLWGVPIRTWEFFNYYTFEYPAAKPGEVIITPELYRLEEQPEGEYLLQIGVSSEVISNENRAPMNITLVLDESGSMSGPPMEMQKETCRAIAASLKVGDIVSMVGWDVQNAVKLAGYKVSGPDDETLLEKCNALTPGGGTDLHGGLTAGYDLAHASYDKDRINRVVLVSDGGANAGITDIDIIAGGAGGNNEDGIYLVGVGVGSYDTYKDGLMDTVTDAGKGASVFIPSAEEAWKVFNEDFVNTMAVAVRDVQVKLDMPPGFEIVKFSGEEYSDNPAEIEPQHLAPNDTMVFHQTIATCAPELIADDTPITVTARYKDAITFEQKEIMATVTFGELLGVESPMVRKGAAVFAYVEALDAAKSQTNAAAAKAEAEARIATAKLLLPTDTDLDEMSAVLAALQ
ncbi:MAG: VWA domain-containing protein [Myxococcales bacterium]|nr:VWA domain-containing protein [Myxococcales bacterium]